MKRDLSKDGVRFCDRIHFYFLNIFAGFWQARNPDGCLMRAINRFLIGKAVKRTRSRPHPFSTASPYTSWHSLTDRTFFGRHLPPKVLPSMPKIEEVVRFFVRPGGNPRLCPKSTLLFAAFAQYLTDNFLRTEASNRAKTTSTHELDLSALYGRTIAQTNALRLRSETLGQRGRLKSQFLKPKISPELKEEEYPPFYFLANGITVDPQFRDLDAPLGHDPNLPNAANRKIFAVGGDRANSTPQVAMINTLFLREHNRIARELETANPLWDDERVFQTARNILIVAGIRIVIEDYINHISSLAFPIRFDPSIVWNANWNKPNWMAVEFNLLYRWHSLTPDTIRWNGQDIPAQDMTLDNNWLIDAGAAKALEWTSAQPACALGVLNTAKFLQNLPKIGNIEELTIRMGRTNLVTTYNDYRVMMGMEPVNSFGQISGDQERKDRLQALYPASDDVEFYTGLFAEDTQRNSPLPRLMAQMVAVDAFSQALTNPLLSEHVYTKDDTFTPLGREMIAKTRSLRDVAGRNVPNGLGNSFVSLTRADWIRQGVPF